jgi:hypothetical protein
MFKKGQKVRLFVHGAGTVSEETATIESITKKGIKLDDADRLYDPVTGRTPVLAFGFWFEIKPLKR